MKPGPFRYWGNIDPRTRRRTPVNAVPGADLDGTIAKLRIYDPIDSYGEFWGVSAKEVVQALDALPSNITDIHLHLNSPGGEVFEGVAIVNALRNHPARVTAIVDGLAASAASFLAVSADEVVMGRNTQLMIHDAWGIAMGPAADMHAMGDLLDKLSNNIASIYLEKAGGDLAAWRDLMLAETWYDPAEAVDAGLADRIEAAADAADDAQNAFDLSVFQHAGRPAAPAPVVPKSSTTTTPEPDDEFARRHAARQHAENARRHGLPVSA